MPLNRAIKEWKGKLGEEVRMAALHREISKLSLESRRVLLACAYMGGASTVELKQVTGYDDVRMTSCIAELQSLFLLAAPEFIREIPRFKVPSNTARLVAEKEKELVPNPASLKKTISNLRAGNRTKRVNRVAEAIAQGNALLREKRFDEAIKTVEAVGNRYGDNPDLLLMRGRCYFEKSKEYNNERSYNIDARRLFKKAYDLGQRRDLLYEMWHQSELDADHPNGALEVSDAAIKDGIGARSEWLLRRTKALYTVSWRHAKAQNVREAQDGFGQCVDDIRRAIGKGEVSRFQEAELKSVLNRINNDRRDLALGSANDFEGWEYAVETIVQIVKEGDDNIENIRAAVEAFTKMVESVPKDNVGKHHFAACSNRHREVVALLRRKQLIPDRERTILEDKLRALMDEVEARRRSISAS